MAASPVADRDVAIIGVSCRFPGHSNDVSSFWSNLVKGVDCITATPPDRWNAAYYVDSDKDAPGKMNSLRCGFMDHVFEFDHEAFGINKTEAENMDPRQKVLLECTLQTLEDARVEYKRSQTGVFVGAGHQDQLAAITSDLESINAYSITGSALSIASNRVSYVFDLRGPSMTIDTACSSAMTALHMAVQAIRRGECQQAIVAGVNLLVTPSVMVQFSKLGVTSKDGRCKSFSEAADGYVRSEGCGVVMIKPLTAALRDHNHIYAVIRGTAINADGHQSPSLTLPSGDAQQQCFRASCVDASIDARQVFFAEAHATGTKVGDPVEANSIGKIFGEGRSGDAADVSDDRGTAPRTEAEILRIGSVKTHVGHLEYASFMAGLIKCILMLHYQTLIPNLYSGPGWPLNRDIEFDRYHMRVQSKHESFDAHMKLMMISSFGFGGANGCAIIQGYKQHRAALNNDVINGIKSGCMNGTMVNSNTKGFKQMDGIGSHGNKDHSCTSTPLPPYLFVLSAATFAALQARIEQAQAMSSDVSPYDQYAISFTLVTRPLHRCVAFAVGSSIHSVSFSAIEKLADTAGPVVWCFGGIGAQHPEMGRTLYQAYPVFRSAIDEMDQMFQRLSGDRLVRDVGLFGSLKGDPTAALYALPSLVLLQTALCDLWRSFGFTPNAVFGHSLGEIAALYAAGVCNKNQIVETAYYLARLLANIDGKEEVLAGLAILGGSATPALPYFSTTHPGWKVSAFDTAYIWDCMEGVVHLPAAVKACIERFGSDCIFQEMSPHPVLEGYLADSGAAKLIPTLHRDQDEEESIYKALMHLKIQGHSVNFFVLLPHTESIPFYLPYAFQHQYCHREDHDYLYKRTVPNHRYLVGRQISNISTTYQQKLSIQSHPWVCDHVVQGPVVFPAAAYLEMCMEVLTATCVEDVTIGQALIVPSDTNAYRTLRTLVEDEGNTVKIYSKMDQWDPQPWTLHVTAHKLKESLPSPPPPPEWCSKILHRCNIERQKREIYDRFWSVGLQYGPLFQGLTSLKSGDQEAVGIIEADMIHSHSTQFILHPALLDSIFHVLLGSIRYLYACYVPTCIKRLQWFTAATDIGSKLRVFAQSHWMDDILEGNIVIMEEYSDTLVGIVEGIQCSPLGMTADKSGGQPSYKNQWQSYAVSDTFIPIRTSSWSAITPDVLSYEPLLDAACIAYASDMLKANNSSASQFQTDSWPIHRQRYWRWCQELIANKQIDNKAVDALQTIVSSCPDHLLYQECKAITRVGSDLLTLLSDPYAVQRVLFADSLMSDIYSLSLTFKPYLRVMSEMVMNFIASHPNRVIHVLEIGAGTGALAHDIFALLQQAIDDLRWKGRIKYYFTDVSNKFLHDARARFQAYPFIDYKLYNIDEDPVKQQIPAHSIDLVLAFDVLHVSASLSQSLHAIQIMLVPHGLLMCIELTRPWIWTQMFFGLFQGWWGFSDERRRCWLTQGEWKVALDTAGYHDIHIMCDRQEDGSKAGGDNRPSQEFCHSIITCHAPTLRRIIPHLATSTIVSSTSLSSSSLNRPIVIFDASGPGHDIYHLLSQSQQLIKNKTATDFYLLTVDSQNIAAYHSDSLEPNYASLIGFTRVLSNEATQHRIVMIDFSSQQTAEMRKEWYLIVKQLIENSATQEREFLVRDGQLYVPRFVSFKPKDLSPIPTPALKIHGQQLPPFRLEIDAVGQLSSLRYHLSPSTASFSTSSTSAVFPYTSDDVVVSVHASALNFKDLMLALGMLKNPLGVDQLTLRFDPPTVLGIEFSGVIVAVGSAVTDLRVGEEVFGIGKHCLANQIVTSQHFVAPKPAHLSHTEAASMPIVFSTAYAGLIDKARIQKGETVLVHSAAGGIGQASIQLCQYVGATIIATVSSNSKRVYLGQRYGIHKFADSHSSADWRETILKCTANEGVDAVINSLKGEAVTHGLECLNVGGRFVEIGKVDILANNPLPMKLLLKDISFLSVQLDILMQSNSEKIRHYLTRIVELTESRLLSPIVDRVFGCADVETAFRYLMAGQHMGKIVLDFSPEAQQALVQTSTVLSPSMSLLYPPSSPFSPAHVNIFSGGCGALSLKLVYYMAVRGARYFVLLSRRGPNALRPSEQEQLQLLEKHGVKIQIATADVTDLNSVAAAYYYARQRGFPCKVALFHLAMVLDDDSIIHLTNDRLTPVLNSKVLGIKTLVSAFPQANVAYVVLFSSAASVLGNTSQSNYAAANAFLDAYSFYLASKGYLCKVVNLGSVEDVGVLAEDHRLRQVLIAKGFAGGLTSTAVAHFTEAMIQDQPDFIYSSSITQASSPQYLLGAFDWSTIVTRYPILSTRFAHLVDHTISASDTKSIDQPTISLSSLIAAIAALLGIPVNKLDEKEPLKREGLDSLLAVELSSFLQKKFGGLKISQMELLSGMTVQNIWDMAQAQQAMHQKILPRPAAQEEPPRPQLSRASSSTVPTQAKWPCEDHGEVPALVKTKMDVFYYRVTHRWGGQHLIKTDLRCSHSSVMVNNNDYLSLGRDPELMQAQVDALRQYGNGQMMSSVFLEEPNLQSRFEEEMAQFLKVEAVVTFQSGYCANVGLLQSIASEETPVYIDALAHASLWEGARSANARIIPFAHNDLDHLREMLKVCGAGIVAVDAVYSTNGDICPLVEITSLCNAFECVLVVDESHSLGLYGEQGQGMVYEMKLQPMVHFITVSLAKAFCGRGGIVTCSKRFKDYLFCTSLPSIFSTAVSAGDAGGFIKAISLIKKASDKRQALKQMSKQVKSALSKMNYITSQSDTPIIALLAGSEKNVIIIRDCLNQHDVFGSVFAPPATTEKTTCYRLTLTSSLTEEMIQRIIFACKCLKREWEAKIPELFNVLSS